MIKKLFLLVLVISLSAASGDLQIVSSKYCEDKEIIDYLLEIADARTEQGITNAENNIFSLLDRGSDPGYQELKMIYFCSGEAGAIPLNLYFIKTKALFNDKTSAFNRIYKKCIQKGFIYTESLAEICAIS